METKRRKKKNNHMYLKTLLEICAHLRGEAVLWDGDVTAGAGDRCCCSFSSGSQGVQRLPLGSDSPNCRGWHWGPGTSPGLPHLGSGDRSCAPTDGNRGFFLAPILHLLGPNVLLFALTRSSRCWICRWDFFYSGSIIIVVIWPQLQWNPTDPAAGLGECASREPLIVSYTPCHPLYSWVSTSVRCLLCSS